MTLTLTPLSRRLFRGVDSCGSLLIAGCLVASVNANPNDTAWSLLIGNRPVEAREIFLGNAPSSDRMIAGEAQRGLAEIARFLGDDAGEAQARFQSCRADNQTTLLVAGLFSSASFGRSAEGYKIKEGYRILRDLAKRPSIFNGQFNDLLVERYANDGNLRQAFKILDRMGIARTWMFIGPFDNVSNAGYNKAFPPETEIDYSRTYPGKDGNEARWSLLDNRAPSGWIFTENHSESRNAVFYFSCTVSSTAAHDSVGYLAFGASGSFKIFLNGACVCADSAFRNTGPDAFITRVSLRAGNNSLLVKLCHEWGASLSEEAKLSNFQLRFLDRTYAPCTNIAYSVTPFSAGRAASGAGGSNACSAASSPLLDTIVGELSARLAKKNSDIDAALLLIKTYNGLEKTDDGQILARRYLKKYPQSSLWHELYAESLLRARKYTEGETELKTAYAFCHENAMAWTNELHSVAQGSDPGKVLDFIEKSPQPVASSLAALIAAINADVGLEKKSEVLKGIAALEKKYSLNEIACTALAGIYIEQGDARKAEALIRGYLRHRRTDSKMYKTLATLAIKQGDIGRATGIIFESLKYDPNNAASYYTLASLNYSGSKFKQALTYIDKCLALTPSDADALTLKGNILVSLGDSKQAERTFTDEIRFTSDDFNAWENLRALQNKPALESFAPLPAVDSLLVATRPWEFRASEGGAILSWINDIFYYPSRCSRERTFFVVALSTQKAIDTWKEYSIEYNSHFQVLHVTRALSYRSDGSQVQADVMKNRVVFKSLEPGDCIVLEWSLKNYYMGDMATNVFGSQEFEFSYPSFDTRLRLVTPARDTIPFRVFGDSIITRTSLRNDYRVTEFTYPARKNALDETFMATDWPEKKKVIYSTFSGWSDIVTWYDGLTRHKLDNTLELKALADSLFAGCTTAVQKIAKIHEYVTGSVRYSYVPFRQSGWIPQEAHDVLAAKIGDCKDMASLGKSLCDRAEIPSCLVLVNTEVRHYTDHTAVGPDFNHCILCCTVEGADRFVDLTASNFAMVSLPKEDQGAMALLIRPGSGRVFTLPFDKPDQDRKRRTVVSVIDGHGTLRDSVATLRTGRFAGEFRDRFRFLSEERRIADMHQILAQTCPDVTLDTFTVSGLNRVGDSISSVVASTARNTVTFSGRTAIFALHIADNVEADAYPVEEKRTFPIDMSRAWYDISSTELTGTITYPPPWKPIILPENVSVVSPYGSYRMEFKRNANTIFYHRTATFALDKQLSVSEHARLKIFLNSVSKSDVIQLLFFTK